MNIIYNHPVTDEELEIFELIQEFVYTHLKDKSLFYRITVNFYDNDSKNGALLRPSGRIHVCKNQLQTRIAINSYILKIRAKCLIRLNNPVYKSYEQLRYFVIFHEFAHLVINYNDPEKMKIEAIPNRLVLNQKDEDNADNMAIDFLKAKEVFVWEEDDKSAV